MSLKQALHDAFIGNPLLRRRWETGTAYTWNTIAHLVLAMILILMAAYKFRMHQQLIPYVEIMEPEFQAEMGAYYNLPSHWMLHYHNPNLRTGRGTNTREINMLETATSMFHFVLVLGGTVIGAIFLIKQRRKRWNSPFQDEMRLLPVTPAQFLVARYDVFFLKLYAILLLGALLLFVPAPSTGHAYDLADAHWQLSSNGRVLAFTVGLLLIWFPIWRTMQCMAFCRYQKPYLMMLGAWVPMILVLCLVFYFVFMQILQRPLLFWSLTALWYASVAFAFAVGIHITPRILAWEEEPKEYHLKWLVKKVI